MNMSEIQSAARKYAAAARALANIDNQLECALSEIRKKYAARIEAAQKELSAAYGETVKTILKNPEEFESPRVQVIDDTVKLGFTAARAKIECNDEEKAAAIIRKIYPELSGILIRSKECIAKEAAKGLTDEQQRKLGIIIHPAHDVVTIKLLPDALQDTAAKYLKG